MDKFTKICLDHLEYGRKVQAAPKPTLFFKDNEDDIKAGVKRKTTTSRKKPPATKKIRKALGKLIISLYSTGISQVVNVRDHCEKYRNFT